MSDFETFDNDFGNNEVPEQDPAADFIQREQDTLAKIENPEVGLTDFADSEYSNGKYVCLELYFFSVIVLHFNIYFLLVID